MNANDDTLALMAAILLTGRRLTQAGNDQFPEQVDFEIAALEAHRLNKAIALVRHEPVAARRAAVERLNELEELLRSACAIAERAGANTAWERFIRSVNALGLNGVTARTYRVEATAATPRCPDCGQPQHSPGDCYMVEDPPR